MTSLYSRIRTDRKNGMRIQESQKRRYNEGKFLEPDPAALPGRFPQGGREMVKMIWPARTAGKTVFLLLEAEQGSLRGLHIVSAEEARTMLEQDGTAQPHLADPADWQVLLDAYGYVCEILAGRPADAVFPFEPAGTDFQKQAWAEIRRIPRGETASYGEIARRMGQPGAARAVGAACRSNPLLLITPCHRVVSSEGRGGFTCSGLSKEELLALENVCLSDVGAVQVRIEDEEDKA